MAEAKAGRQQAPSQESKRRDVPMDSSSRPERESLGELEGRRQHLSEEEEMARRSQRAQLMRQKNRLRARR